RALPDDAVRPPRTRPVSAPRPPALPRPAAAVHSVADAPGGERLPLPPLVLDAREREPQTAARPTTNQRRQPCVCTHRSLKRPFGLSRTNRYCDHSSSLAAGGSAG